MTKFNEVFVIILHEPNESVWNLLQTRSLLCSEYYILNPSTAFIKPIPFMSTSEVSRLIHQPGALPPGRLVDPAEIDVLVMKVKDINGWSKTELWDWLAGKHMKFYHTRHDVQHTGVTAPRPSKKGSQN